MEKTKPVPQGGLNAHSVANDECVLCSSHSVGLFRLEGCGFVTSDERFVHGTPIAWLECKECGGIWLDPRLRVDVNRYYSRDYDFLMEEDEDEPALGDGRKFSSVLVRMLERNVTTADVRILDIGAGKGNFIKAVHERFPRLECWAVEPSRAYERLCKLSWLQDCRHDFFKARDYAGCKFDFITLIGVLEHVPDPAAFLADISLLMGAETRLLVEIPNFHNNPADLLVCDHLTKFTESSARILFAKCGLEVLDSEVPATVGMRFVLRRGEKSMLRIPVALQAERFMRRIDEVFEGLEKYCGPLVSWGRNALATVAHERFRGRGLEIKAVVDDNAQYQGRLWKCAHVPIVGRRELEANYPDLPILLALSPCYYANVQESVSGRRVFAI